MLGKQLQQHRIGSASVQNDHGTHTVLNRFKRCFGLGDHSAGNRPLLGEVLHLLG